MGAQQVASRRPGLTVARTPAALPGVVAVLALLAMWLLSDVRLLDALRYLGYLAAFILAPGCLLERVLRPGSRAALDRLGTGWALGYAVELAVFALTAALGVRSLLPWLILAFAAACGLALMVTRARRDPQAADPGAARTSATLHWAVGGLAILAAIYVAVAYFTASPLPDSVPTVSYYADFPFHLGIAGEALHHWPIQDPKVVGTALPYETFVYMHLASAAQITGLGLPLILLRLDIPTMVIALVIGVAAAGRTLTGRAVVGLIAVVLVLFVGELHPNPTAHFTFLNTFFYSEYTSPTFLFGLVLFVPALQALIELTTTAGDGRKNVRGWVLLMILVVACAGAKATIVPVLLGGSVLALLVWALMHRQIPRAALIATALLAGVFATFQLTLYRGFTGGLQFNPPGSVRSMDVMALINAHIHSHVLGVVFWVIAVPLGIIGFCAAPMVGLLGVMGRPLRLWPARQVLLLSMLVAGFVPFLAFSQFGSSQNFFTYYGYLAGCLLSAEGLSLLWRRWSGSTPVPLGRVAVAAAIGLAAIGGVIYAIDTSISSPIARYGAWFGALLLIFIVGIAWTLKRPRREERRRAALGVVVGVLVLGALEAPLEVVPSLTSALVAGHPLYDARSRLLTRGLYQGLVWVKDHTSPSAVLAVNNQYVGSTGRVPGYMYYSAFTERRIFLEGWAYTVRASNLGAGAVTFGGLPAFPGRLALNRAVFEHADPRALARMTHSYGVRYLLVDRLHGGATGRLSRLGRVVYDSPSLTVYRVA